MKPPHHFHSAGLHATDLHAVEVHAAELKMVGHKATEAKVSGPAVWERRRPMRPDSVSPHLIPLLRGRRATEAELAERASSEGVANFGDPDQARPAMGLAVGTTLSIALWAGIYFAVHWALV